MHYIPVQKCHTQQRLWCHLLQAVRELRHCLQAVSHCQAPEVLQKYLPESDSVLLCHLRSQLKLEPLQLCRPAALLSHIPESYQLFLYSSPSGHRGLTLCKKRCLLPVFHLSLLHLLLPAMQSPEYHRYNLPETDNLHHSMVHRSHPCCLHIQPDPHWHFLPAKRSVHGLHIRYKYSYNPKKVHVHSNDLRKDH